MFAGTLMKNRKGKGLMVALKAIKCVTVRRVRRFSTPARRRATDRPAAGNAATSEQKLTNIHSWFFPAHSEEQVHDT